MWSDPALSYTLQILKNPLFRSDYPQALNERVGPKVDDERIALYIDLRRGTSVSGS